MSYDDLIEPSGPLSGCDEGELAALRALVDIGAIGLTPKRRSIVSQCCPKDGLTFYWLVQKLQLQYDSPQHRSSYVYWRGMASDQVPFLYLGLFRYLCSQKNYWGHVAGSVSILVWIVYGLDEDAALERGEVAYAGDLDGYECAALLSLTREYVMQEISQWDFITHGEFPYGDWTRMLGVP